MKKLALIPAALLAVALAACGPEEPATEPFPTPETYGPFVEDYHSTPVAPPRAVNLTIGQPSTMTLTDGVTLDLTIDAATPIAGADCTSSIYEGALDQQFVRLDFTVTTNETVPDDYTTIFDPYVWKVRGDDGRVIDDAGMTFSCLAYDDTGADFYEWETNSIYSGSVAVPKQGANGTIILDPSASETRFELRY